jgi:hypothetical protein
MEPNSFAIPLSAEKIGTLEGNLHRLERSCQVRFALEAGGLAKQQGQMEGCP